MFRKKWNSRRRSWRKFVTKFVRVSMRYVDRKKKKEKTGKKIYEYISFLTKDCNSCIGLKRVRCISCFCVPSNVVSTALNEYPRELFRFVIRFLFAVSFTFVYFTMCWNMESVPVTRSIIFEHREIYSTSSVTVTFPRPVKEPWNLRRMKLRRKEKACRIGNVNVRYLVIEVAAGYSSCFFFFFIFLSCLGRRGKFDIQIQWRGVRTHAVETTSIYNSPNLCTVRYNGFGWFYQALPGKGCHARCVECIA